MYSAALVGNVTVFNQRSHALPQVPRSRQRLSRPRSSRFPVLVAPLRPPNKSVWSATVISALDPTEFCGGRCPPPRASSALRIFNPDGSEAEKSGNGLRIFSRFLWDQGLVKNPTFTRRNAGRTRAVIHQGEWPAHHRRDGPRVLRQREDSGSRLRARGARTRRSRFSIANSRSARPPSEIRIASSHSKRSRPLSRTNTARIWKPTRTSRAKPTCSSFA